jgi:exodeoxyribonuclease-5
VSASITVEQLSNDQRDAYDDIMRWVERSYMGDDSNPLLTLGGYAGTGKSTLVSLVAEQANLPAFCAYTGKATSVLRRKLREAGTATVGAQRPGRDGAPSLERKPFCGTIHSLIYRPCACLEPQPVALEKPCPEKNCPHETQWAMGGSVCGGGHVDLIEDEKAFEKLKAKTKLIYAQKGPDGVCIACGDRQWIRREALDRHYDLIIVDEASMVDDKMLRDLLSYQIPILAVGDHGQLPPVGGSGSLMKAPMLRLERIHRQAEGNPIIALSKMIREEGRLPQADLGDAVRFGHLRFVDRILEERYEDASAERLLEMGLACYTNRRRVGLNTSVRRARGIARTGHELPVEGEHVVCLRNIKARDGSPPIANGMRGVLTSNAVPSPKFDVRGDKKISESETHLRGTIAFPEDEIDERPYEMLWKQFGRDKTFNRPEDLARETGIFSFAMAGALFDFGFAMTVHKMQGSQFDDLVVCAERPGPVSDDDWRRWLYTAVTRAALKLTILR